MTHQSSTFHLTPTQVHIVKNLVNKEYMRLVNVLDDPYDVYAHAEDQGMADKQALAERRRLFRLRRELLLIFNQLDHASTQ